MALCCAISNDVPEHPVISPVSGSIFEKRLVEKYVIENGVDPINGKDLTIEQLIEVKTPPLVKPKPPSATSIPAILKTLQDEWDAVMLHSFTQRQQLQTARQELSHALYQHDAACRVIARLTKEVTAAREALATLKPQAGVAAPVVGAPAAGVEPSPAAVEEMGMTEDVIQKLQDKATVLTQERKRKGRNVPDDLASVEALRNLRVVASYPGLHSASGILCLDICASDTSKMVTGGNDGNAVVFNKDLERRLATLEGHSKKVTRVVYHPEEDLILTASPDKTIRVWDVSKMSAERPLSVDALKVIEIHDDAVTGLSLHPTGDYVLSTSADHHWAFTDIRSGKLLTKVLDESAGTGLTTAQFHPDGLIFGTGTSDSQVKIWDLKEQSNVANFPGHSGPVTAIAFSENGYYLATAAEDACVKLWDLRKLKNFKTLQMDERYEIKDLSFDQSGTYLAVAGSDVRLFVCKQWQELKILKEHKEGNLATAVRFGRLSHFVASTSMDRSLKIYGV